MIFWRVAQLFKLEYVGDIEQLRASFIETLKGRFHVRVRYPGNELITAENVPDLALPAHQFLSRSNCRAPPNTQPA